MKRREILGASAASLALLSACGGGSGGSANGDGNIAPPPEPQPAPSPVPNPEPRPDSHLLLSLLNFAETAARNWNFDGHSVTSQFTASQGLWDYTNSTYEPWLFDRAHVWHLLAKMTGNARWTTQSETDLTYYQSRLDANGYFLNKAGEQDTKYSYVHAWGGDALKAQAAYAATVAGWPNIANLSPGALWTEREVWVALQAACNSFQANGQAAARSRARAMLDQWDAVCAGRGAPLVSYTQHEGGGPGGTLPTDLVSSPWMSALYFQAARELAVLDASIAPQVYRQASDYFDWLNVPANRGFYPGSDAHPEFTELTFPAYLAGGTLIGDAGADEGHMDHALDVAGLVAFAAHAKSQLGLPATAAEARLMQLKETAKRSFANWTRNTLYLPKYRITPSRKFNWWVRGFHELYHLNRDG
jgi:hypothetical protein